jgi:hypothetical protein
MREKKNAKNREKGERKNIDVKQKFRALSRSKKQKET